MERQAFHHRHRHLHRHPSDMPFIMPVWRYGVTCLSSPSSSSSPPSARHDVHDSHDSLSGTVRVMTHLHNSCERACTEDPGVLHACCPTVYSVYYMRAALQSTACTTCVLPTVYLVYYTCAAYSLQRVLHVCCLLYSVYYMRSAYSLQCVLHVCCCSAGMELHAAYSVYYIQFTACQRVLHAAGAVLCRNVTQLRNCCCVVQAGGNRGVTLDTMLTFPAENTCSPAHHTKHARSERDTTFARTCSEGMAYACSDHDQGTACPCTERDTTFTCRTCHMEAGSIVTGHDINVLRFNNWCYGQVLTYQINHQPGQG